ncbi:hypothetical protein [Alkaliphilus crotonatoxidans]
MLKTKLAILLVLMIFFSSSFTYAYESNTIEHLNELDNIINCKDYSPTEILHHTCGRGGSSCDDCFDQFLLKSCGCQIVTYKCCCGKVMNQIKYWCQTHRN